MFVCDQQMPIQCHSGLPKPNKAVCPRRGRLSHGASSFSVCKLVAILGRKSPVLSLVSSPDPLFLFGGGSGNETILSLALMQVANNYQ